MSWWADECWRMRTACHMSGAEAARANFLDRKTWYRWEHGYTDPKPHVKEAVRDVMAAELVAYRDAQRQMLERARATLAIPR